MAFEHNSIEKPQRSFSIKKSLKELIHKPRSNKTQNRSISLPPFPPHEKNSIEYAYDVLYECQRGSLAVGYSSKTLLQLDPNPWCDADMRFTPMNIENYQLPDPTWEWDSKDWMIDMTEDVDEAGWQYALKFHGADWHGNYKHFRSFVRRRRWIRLRHRIVDAKNNHQDITNAEEPSSIAESCSTINFKHNDIIERLKQCRLDRERLSLLNNTIKLSLPSAIDQLLDNAIEYMNYFDYDQSKVQFIMDLLKKKCNLNNEGKLTSQEIIAIQSLTFYHDIQTILDHVMCQSTSKK